jgi:hypothetical protein
MANDKVIDFSQYLNGTRERAETEEVSRQIHPQRDTRPQTEKERTPDAFQRQQERDGRSEWSGGNMGGGTWAGRSR